MNTLERLTVDAFTLPGTPDMLDYFDPATSFYFEHGADAIVGVGAAAVVAVAAGDDQVARAARQARHVLDAIEGAPGAPSPVVVGAIPFAPARPARLVVPRIALIRRGGRTTMLVTGRADMPEPESGLHEVPPEPWTSLRVTPEPAPERYVAAVAEAVRRIDAHALDKVVLARSLLATSDHDFDVLTLLARLRDVEPRAYVFGAGGFIGATPELLVRREGATVTCNPLAGTARRGADAIADARVREELLASDKDRREHAVAADAVAAILEPLCERLERPTSPETIATSTVWHLSTLLRGELRAPAPDALSIASMLHPTPAVCGSPREQAREAIARLEGFDRGLYAGIVGWTDADGDGEWAVSLRCAEIAGRVARLYAGAGIVAGSDPDAELAETDAKFAGMLDALGYA